jgi:RNA 2',3'-cyclic 3'-phosphodiesterase
MKRIFVAIKVDAGQELLKMIAFLKEELGGDLIKWTHIGNIHVTLVFLGDTDENKIAGISAMLAGICRGYGAFQLNLKGCGIFKNIRDPRIIWTGIRPSDKLSALNDSITSGLRDLKIDIEDRPYNPHLTIGRIKKIHDSELLGSLMNKYQNREIQIVQVNEIILFESILLPAGPQYKPLAKFSLGKSY